MKATQTPVLQAADVQIGYRSKRGAKAVVAEHIDVDLHAGELICLLGPNGSGKSTLIRTLAGMQPMLDGNISLFGKHIAELSVKEIAKRLSTVLTDRVTIGNLTVYTMVAFGRAPYTGWLGSLSQEDEEVVRRAIEAAGLRAFVHRDVARLSDGERQKVMIARALAQDTPVILLDEPTAHLDLPNRVEIIRLLRRLAHETGKGILLSTHELDLALKAADRIWLMNRRQELISGVPEDLVLNGTFEQVFKQDSFDFDRATGSFRLHQSEGREVSLAGDAVAVFWTRRALEREGFRVLEEGGKELGITVSSGPEAYRWTVQDEEEQKECASVRELIAVLRSRK